MDVSNPVIDSTRCQVGQLAERSALRVKQDLSILQKKVEGQTRTVLPTPKRVEPEDWIRFEKDGLELYEQLTELTPPVTHGCDLTPLVLQGVIKKVSDGCPVDGLCLDGIRIHPTGVDELTVNGMSCVSTKRKFGDGQRVMFALEEAQMHFDAVDIEVSGSKYIYTYGTPVGFLERIKKQMGMPVVKASRMYEGKPKTRSWLRKKLNVLFDIKRMADLPRDRWEGPLLDIIDKVEVAGDATAGFPYCKEKSFAYEEMVREGSILESIVALYKTEGKAQFLEARNKMQREHPEWFLCELKNKLDRYEVEKLDKKCRPYLALPFHHTVLQSNLCQLFCKNLPNVTNNNKTHNAYGMSPVDGGLMKLRDRISSIKVKEVDFYCYGDDTDIYYRDKDGILWRCSPDFTQMDGGVDSETVETTCEWVYETLKDKTGGEDVPMWHNVTKEWANMACNPMFVCDGPIVYEKSRPHGIMSGVVGTTLFDTVKSVLAYDALKERVGLNLINKDQLFNAEFMTTYFREQAGLVLKEGTWSFFRVKEDLEIGQLWSPTKFLGVYWKYLERNGQVHLYPHLKDHEFLELALNPRKLPAKLAFNSSNKALKANKNKNLGLDLERYKFDWARGLYITCAFSDEDQASFCNAIVNTCGPTAVLMDVQAGGGKGQALLPSYLAEIWGEGPYNFVDSQGFPDKDWVMQLYNPQKEYEDQGQWLAIYPNLSDWVSKLRRQRRAKNPLLMVSAGNVERSVKKGEKLVPVVASVKEETHVAPVDVHIGQVKNHEIRVKTTNKIGKTEVKRTPKLDVKVGGVEPRTRDPMLSEQFKKIMERAKKYSQEGNQEFLAHIEGRYSQRRYGVPDFNSRYFKESTAPLKDELARYWQVKNGKEKVFSLPLHSLMQMSGWGEAKCREATAASGYLVSRVKDTDWVTAAPIVTGGNDNRLEKSYADALKIAKDDVVRSKDREASKRGASVALSKRDIEGEWPVSKVSLPRMDAEWLPIDLKLTCLANFVETQMAKVDLKNLEGTVQNWWTALCSQVFSVVDDNGTFREPRDHEEFHETAQHFRFGFKCETLEVGVGNRPNKYAYCLGVARFVAGRIEPVQHYTPVLSVRTDNMDTAKKVMRNILLTRMVPQFKGYITNENGELVQSYMEINDRPSEQENWFKEVVEEKRMETRKPEVKLNLKQKQLIEAIDKNGYVTETSNQEDRQELPDERFEPGAEEGSQSIDEMLRVLLKGQAKIEQEIKQLWRRVGQDRDGRSSC